MRKHGVLMGTAIILNFLALFLVQNEGASVNSEETYENENIYRFVVMADSRSDEDKCQPQLDPESCINKVMFQTIMRSIQSLSPPPLFILFGGDMIYGSLSGEYVEKELIAWKSIIDEVMGPNYAKFRIYPVFGNHEGHFLGNGYDNIWSAFTKVFDPVKDGILSCQYYDYDPTHYGHTVYYCDYMNDRFFVLNNVCNPDPSGDPSLCVEHQISSQQLQWLESKLVNNGKDHNFFIHHEPAFGTYAHGVDPPPTMDAEQCQRDKFVEVLAANNTIMIFSGHEHQYSRRLINVALTQCDQCGFQCDFNESFYEVKTGTAGAPIYRSYMDKGLMNIIVGPVYEYHYAVVDVSNTVVNVSVYAVNEKGNINLVDRFRHPPADPPPLPIKPRKHERDWQGTEDAWRYFKGTKEPPPQAWNDINFDDSKWFVGPTGIGYGDNDDSTILFDMINNYLSVYARRTFTVEDPIAITKLTLAMDYDDGFVAYLNGIEVARENITGNPPSYNTSANSPHEANGCFTTHTYDIDPAILVSGINVLAIQGHNVVINSSDLSIIPLLSTEPIPEIMAEINGNVSCSSIISPQGNPLTVKVTLLPGGYDGDLADWWAVAETPFGWYYYNVNTNSWQTGMTVTYQGLLFDLSPYEILNMSGLPVGTYTFYFGVDTNMNGNIDMGQIYYDSVGVNVTP